MSENVRTTDYIASVDEQRFDIDWPVFRPDEIDVYLNGALVALDLYIYDRADPAIVFHAGLVAGDKVTIKSAMTGDRTGEFVEQMAPTAAALNREFDERAAVDIDLGRDLAGLKDGLPFSTNAILLGNDAGTAFEAIDMGAAASRANSYLYFDGVGRLGRSEFVELGSVPVERFVLNDADQALSDGAKATARGNIDAASAGDITALRLETADHSERLATQEDRDLLNPNPKQAVDLATTGSITLAGEQIIDGEPTAGFRVLVKDEADKSRNGVYLSADGAWVRVEDADAPDELSFATFYVSGGVENGGKEFIANVSDTVAIGTDEIIFILKSDNSALGSRVTDLEARAGSQTDTASAVINDLYLEQHFPAQDAIYQHSVYEADLSYLSTFSGWRGPFSWGGDAFDLIKIYMQVENPATVVLTVSDSALGELARTEKWVEKTGYHWFKLPIFINSDITNNNVLHMGFSAGSKARMMPGNCNGAALPDTVLYDAYYTTTSAGADAWFEVVNNNEAAYDMDFKLFNTSVAIPAAPGSLSNQFNSAFLIESGIIDYDSKSAVNIVAGAVNPIARGGTFSGWGANYTHVAGDAFNLVRIQSLKNITASDSERWSKLQVRVTDTDPNGTLIAYAELAVDPLLNELSNLEFLLLDPATDSPIVLSDANLPAQYAIGYIAINSEGGRAHGGEPRGSMANFAGDSYYIVQSGASWLNFSGDPSLAFETFFAVNGALVDRFTLRDSVIIPPLATAESAELSDFPPFYNEILGNLSSKILQGQQVTVGFTGDSWTHSSHRYVDGLRDLMNANGGVAGFGWITANADISAPTGSSRTRTGTWADIRHSSQDVTGRGGIGPEGAHAHSETVGSTVRFSAPDCDEFTIHYESVPNGGTFSYKFGDTGSETTVSTDATQGYQTLTVADLSGAPGGVLVLEVQSLGPNGEGVVIVGVDARDTDASDVFVVHKLGNGGSTAARFDAIPESYYISAIGALGIDVNTILLGTNEDYGSTAPEQMKTSLSAMISVMRQTNPLCDVLLIGAGPNDLDADDYSLRDYTRAMYSTAVDGDYSFINLQVAFGTYDQANARGLMEDAAHPNALGGRINAGLIWHKVFKPSIEVGGGA